MQRLAAAAAAAAASSSFLAQGTRQLLWPAQQLANAAAVSSAAGSHSLATYSQPQQPWQQCQPQQMQPQHTQHTQHIQQQQQQHWQQRHHLPALPCWRALGAAAALPSPQLQHALTGHHQLLQQQGVRGMSVVVNVSGNKVDGALAKLNRLFRQTGLTDELRKREYRRTASELKFAAKRTAHNKRVGVLIADRLKWVVRRRRLKM